MDFTLSTYKQLLESLIRAGYSFQTVEQFVNLPADKVVVLRHDVDLQCRNALMTARIEKSLNIQATYYFRIVKESNRPDIILQIRELGHEIGYHYEDLSICNGDYEKALKSFENNLAYFREFYPVKTVCMHGSPLSDYDNRKLWDRYDYKDYGIICEPYFDIDYSNVLYLTDTGRRWNGEKVSVRDKVKESFTYTETLLNKGSNSYSEVADGPVSGILSNNYNFRSTFSIIFATERGVLPDKIIFNIHPQRWDNRILPWLKEYIGQNIKNVIKRLFYVR